MRKLLLDSNPVYSFLFEFANSFLEAISDEMHDIRYEIDLVPDTKYCVTQQCSLPRDKVIKMTPLPTIRKQVMFNHIPRQPFALKRRQVDALLFTFSTNSTIHHPSSNTNTKERYSIGHNVQ